MIKQQTPDQWKDRGVCSWCRRNGYCRKRCTANKRKAQAEEERRAQNLLSMTSIDEKNKFIYEALKQPPVRFKRKIIINGAMIYGCASCGSRWFMFLEKGLEDGSENSKPVPFGITCPFCGNFNARDISGYLHLPDGEDFAELPEEEAFFENVPDSDCGKPRYQKMPPNQVIEGVHYSVVERRRENDERADD